jgi:hypothetical protein
MRQEFVPYEQALALKELGFDEPCLGFYNHQGQLILMTQEDENSIQVYKNSYVKLGKQYAVPLHQQAFRWFREKHGLRHFIEYDNGHYNAVVQSSLVYHCDTHEEAELACLKKLIEIAQSK